MDDPWVKLTSSFQTLRIICLNEMLEVQQFKMSGNVQSNTFVNAVFEVTFKQDVFDYSDKYRIIASSNRSKVIRHSVSIA